MQDPWNFLKQEVSRQIRKISRSDATISLEEPSMLGYGDLALPCFDLSKKFGAPPQEIAEDLAKKIKIKYFREVKAVGPYINFYIDWPAFTQSFIGKINKKYGNTNFGKKKKIMVEFSTANTNKPLHIGHARNNVLGDGLCNILKTVGFGVIRADYVGDMGLHIAKTIYAYQHWAKNKKPKGKSDHFIGDLYSMFAKKMEQDPSLEEKAREVLRLWEEGNKEVRETWKKLRKWAIDGQEDTFRRFGIKFDVKFYESQFEQSGKEFVGKLLNKKFAFKAEEGQIVADLEKFGLPNFVILRSDRTSLYQTKELALIDLKFKRYNLFKSVNVVAREHELYFQQVYKLMELLEHKSAGKSYHLSYGLVMLPEGKMSGRTGVAAYLDDLIDMIKKDVLKIVGNKFAKKQAEEIAEKVAIAAIKYALVKISPERNIMFNMKEIAKYEGDTGPYLQYTHARACSILKKAKKLGRCDMSKLSDPRELAVLRFLAKYPATVEKAAIEMRPHIVANYLYMLAESFNNFYQNLPVLKADPKTKSARLKLTESVKIVLASGLSLLGISALEKM